MPCAGLTSTPSPTSPGSRPPWVPCARPPKDTTYPSGLAATASSHPKKNSKHTAVAPAQRFPRPPQPGERSAADQGAGLGGQVTTRVPAENVLGGEEGRGLQQVPPSRLAAGPRQPRQRHGT